MDEACKMARKRIKAATRKEYETLIHEAKLTPLQEEILRRHILCDDSICKISIDLHRSERSVKTSLSKAYKAISQIMHE